MRAVGAAGHQFHWISFPYGVGGSKHAGCAVALRADTSTLGAVCQVISPSDPQLRGRAGLVRVRAAGYNFTAIVSLCPPSFADGSNRKLLRKLRAWVTNAIHALPARTLPVLLTDANARLGLVRNGADGGSVLDRSDAVGDCDPEPETPAGREFMEMLEYTKLTAVNSFFNIGPTCFAFNGLTDSRIDFVCLPCAQLGRVHDARTCVHPYRTGDSACSAPTRCRSSPRSCVPRHTGTR